MITSSRNCLSFLGFVNAPRHAEILGSFPRIKSKRHALILITTLCFAIKTHAVQTDIVGPAGSGAFGTAVAVLPNGNIVVTDPLYDAPGPVADVGAVYLYSPTGTLISTLNGSSANDLVGNAGVTVLSNGNYVVVSIAWGTTDVGAVTWGHSSTGVTGVVSALNSLVGGTAFDMVGSGGVTALSNGNYVVRSTLWNGAASDVGAVTLCDGATGRTGLVSSANSLVGSTANDNVGNTVTTLANGNYVVRSTLWDGAAPNVGAVTWCNAFTGVTGVVSAANSLVGSSSGDNIGSSGVVALPNGHYVVRSPNWDNTPTFDAGAVTWCDGTTGRVGAVSAANSLTSDRQSAQVGSGGFAVLTNGNYVVGSPMWEIGVPGVTDIGAATWCSGSSVSSGLISTTNSLHGSTASDNVGVSIVALSDGNYVVNTLNWDNGSALNAGAATWCDGSTGRTGTISPVNSLVGALSGNNVGTSIAALSNGKYVVNSPGWDDVGSEGVQMGAVTFCDGAPGCTGVVSTDNSLTGPPTTVAVGTAGRSAGSGGITVLANGNYVVSSPIWDDPSVTTTNDPVDAGAVTWCSGTVGRIGTVAAANSLTGQNRNDNVGLVTALANGNYVVSTMSWDGGTATNAGAVMWVNGSAQFAGIVTAANSLVGSTTEDTIGSVTALSDGNYVVRSPSWDNGVITNAGAITLGLGTGGTVGPITANNSVLGTVAGGGPNLVFGYDASRQQLVVGRRHSNLVTLFRYGNSLTSPTVTAAHLANGLFRFSFTSTPGTPFTALMTTNIALPLNNWIALGAVTEISPGQFQFTDSATNSRRFYRVRSP